MNRFKDTFVSREYRFSLGKDQATGGLYLSTPVSGFNRAAEWEAYFSISEEEYNMFRARPESSAAFTEACRMGGNGRLLIHPG
jgi:hypothetical protein